MYTHRCALRVRSAPGTRNFTAVSSPWITRDSNSRWCISRYNGVEQVRRLRQPVAQRRTRDGDAGPGQLPGQAVQRRVVGELGGDDVRQQPGAAQPLGDRPDLRRPGRPEALLGRHRGRVAVPAGVGLLDGAAARRTGPAPGRVARRSARRCRHAAGRSRDRASPPRSGRGRPRGVRGVRASGTAVGVAPSGGLVVARRRAWACGVRMRRPKRCFRAASSLSRSSALSARSRATSASSCRTSACNVGTSSGSGASGGRVVASMPDATPRRPAG